MTGHDKARLVSTSRALAGRERERQVARPASSSVFGGEQDAGAAAVGLGDGVLRTLADPYQNGLRSEGQVAQYRPIEAWFVVQQRCLAPPALTVSQRSARVRQFPVMIQILAWGSAGWQLSLAPPGYFFSSSTRPATLR